MHLVTSFFQAKGADLMKYQDLKNKLFEMAQVCYDQGPGWAQESVVLRELAEDLGIEGNVESEQFMLTCWHDLFRDGDLSWGYSIDNPSFPWFHFPQRNLDISKSLRPRRKKSGAR
jgi:hypothetical protein